MFFLAFLKLYLTLSNNGKLHLSCFIMTFFLYFTFGKRAAIFFATAGSSFSGKLMLKMIISLPLLKGSLKLKIELLGDPEATANLYCNFAHPYWEGYVICSIFVVTSGSPSNALEKKTKVWVFEYNKIFFVTFCISRMYLF